MPPYVITPSGAVRSRWPRRHGPDTGPNREDITRMIPWHHEHPLLPRPATLAVVACILSSSLTLPAAAEDLTIVMRSANGTNTQYISSRLVRDSSPRVDRIYDLVSRTVTDVNHEKKEFWVSTEKEEEVEAEASQRKQEANVQRLIAPNEGHRARMEESAAAARAQIAKEMENLDQQRLSPELRKARLAVLKARQEEVTAILEQDKADEEKLRAENRRLAVEPSVSVEKGTGKKRIAGYDCEQYVVTRQDGLNYSREERWVAPGLLVPSYFEMEKIAQASVPPKYKGHVLNEMKDKGLPLGGAFSSTQKIPLAVPDRGLPPGTTLTNKGDHKEIETSSSWEAAEVKKGPIDASLFRVPAGYTKVESPVAKLAKFRAEGK